MASAAARQLVTDYQALQQRLDKMRKEFTAASKELFLEAAAPLFKKFPKLVSFSWTQYTPHFNDGDTCTFGVNTDDPKIQYGDEDGLEEFSSLEYDYVSDGYEIAYGFNRTKYKKVPKSAEEIAYIQEKKRAVDAVEELLRTFSDEQYEGMFGDHAEIIVSQDGVEVEAYSHD